MDNNINDLLRIIYEIEGLVLVAEKKCENLPQELVSLLKEKVAIFQSLIDKIDTNSNSIQLEQVSSEVGLEADIATPSIEIEEQIKGLDIDSFSPIEIEETIDVATNEIFEDNDSIEVIDDNLEIIELENEIELEPEVKTQEVITVEEKLYRQNSRDLKQAFTINDRYRFRRELFGNSDTEFIDMINLVSAMTSLSEAEDYFYGDLEWDQENEEVRDFMNIITHYFAD